MKSLQEKVLRFVSQISRGKVSTYKEIAKEAGSPRAWRAVGNVLNKNKNLYPPKFSKKTLAGKIPCHRVIKSNGEIGGYRYGTKRKTALLKSEHIKLCARPSTKIIFLCSGKKI